MLQPLTLYRYDGAGNDFLILEADAIAPFGDPRRNPALDRRMGVIAREWCARVAAHGGADGLLLVLPATEIGNDFALRIYNADGSVPEMCGNGMRCAILHWLWSQARVQGWSALSQGRVRVETLAGPIGGALLWASKVAINEIATHGTRALIRIEMGKPRFTWESLDFVAQAEDAAALLRASSLEVLPVALEGETVLLYGASLGNPHVVTFVSDVQTVDLARIGPLIERDPHFAHGTNLHVIQLREPHHLLVRHWERGCGLTQACGTGAVASAVIAIAKGLAASPVVVSVPGGDVKVTWTGQEAQLEGPVVARGSLRLQLPEELP